MPQKTAQFRFYAELNDFLPAEKKQKAFSYSFWGTPSVKDAIEALGIPHSEVDLILLNGVSVGFEQLIKEGDRVTVYPVFESMDISSIEKLRDKPLRDPCFVLDVHLGKLARLLRMAGFDVCYKNSFSDAAIVKLAQQEKRIILTRDLGLLKMKAVTHGYFVRSAKSWEQLKEVLIRFDLRSKVQTFARCLLCNGILTQVEKQKVKNQVQPKTIQYYQEFFQCSQCGKIYWKGSHFTRMSRLLGKLFREMDSKHAKSSK